jgi:hypothetical protein
MFKKTRRKTQKKILSELPEGTFIHTESGYFYVVSPTKRYRFLTTRVLESWHPSKVVEVSESDSAVKKLRVASKMKFRNGSLLYSQASGKMYLVSGNKLRHITNPDWLDFLGYRRDEAVWVGVPEINLHEIGEPLN